MDVLLWFEDVSLWSIGLATAIAFLGYVILRDRSAHNVWTRLGVPQVKPVPMFGSVVEINQKGYAKFDMDCLKKYGKFYGSYWGQYPMLHVADPDLAKEIFVKRFSEFFFRTGADPNIKELQGSVANSFGDQWRFQRSLLSPTFSSGKMRIMNPLIQDCCKLLVDNVQEASQESDGSTNVRSLFSYFTMDVIARTAFGIDVNSQKDPENEFVKHAKLGFGFDDSISYFSIFIQSLPLFGLLSSLFSRLLSKRSLLAKQFEFFKGVTVSLLKERKLDKQKRKDFLQLMLEAHDDEKSEDKEHVSGSIMCPHVETDGNNRAGESKLRALTTDEVAANAFGFFLAGYHTTATTLTYLAYNLALNPDCQERCIDEIERVLGNDSPNYDNLLKLEYLDHCVNETLRLYPPVFRTTRMAFTDTEVAGYKIPKYTVVFIHMYAIHHNPEYWPDPETFDPERFLPENVEKRHPYAFLPFGHGPRHCMGMRLAYMETKAAMATVLQKFRFVRSKHTQVPVKISNSPLLTEDHDMILKVEPRTL